MGHLYGLLIVGLSYACCLPYAFLNSGIRLGHRFRG